MYIFDCDVFVMCEGYFKTWLALAGLFNSFSTVIPIGEIIGAHLANICQLC